MNVLIAEDDELVRKLLTAFLEENGHKAQSAPDGMELVRLAMDKKPDLICTDLHMPNMTGDTMIAMIDMHPALTGVPIIVITGATESEIKDMGISRDIPILLKPLDFKRISRELERVEKKLKR